MNQEQFDVRFGSRLCENVRFSRILPWLGARDLMKPFIEGEDRDQRSLFPDCLEDWISGENPVRVIDVFVDALDLGGVGVGRIAPHATGRPGYHPSVFLKLYI